MASRVAVFSHRSPQRFIFMTPFPGENFAWVLSSGLLISDLVNCIDTNRSTRKKMGSVLRGDLLLVTHAVGKSIEQLRKVRLGNGAVSLEELWPVKSFSRYQSVQRDNPGVFVANVGWVTSGIQGRKIGAVVVDGMHPRTLMHAPGVLKGMANVPIIFVVTPPLGERDLKEFGYPDTARAWLWDPAAQKAVAETISSCEVGCQEMGERYFWVCDDPDVDRCLGEVHELLGQSLRGSCLDFPPLWSAWSIYHRLRQLAVPLAQFEDSAVHAWGAIPLNKRLARLKESWPKEVAIEAQWRGVIEGLNKAYELLKERQEPQKFWGLAERVQANLNENREGLRVVVPSDREVALLSMLLGQIVDGWFDALNEDRIEIVSAKGEARCLARGEERKTLLVGFRAGTLRYLDLYPCHSTEVLAYSYELDVDEAAQSSMYRFAESLQQDNSRCDLLKSIGLPPCQGGRYELSPRPKVVVAGEVENRVRKVRKPLIDPTYLDFQKLSNSEMALGWGEDIFEDRGGREISPRDEVERIQVFFGDGSCVGYGAWQYVDVYHHGTGQIERQNVTELQPSMRVVSMADGVYDQLYDRLLEALYAKESPYYTMALALWEEAKMAALQLHHGNKKALYRKLSERGLHVDYGAVIHWYQGGKLDNPAPQRYSDMKLLADMSGKYPEDKLIKMTWGVIKLERGRRIKAGRALHALLRAIVQGDGYETAIRSARELGSEIGEVFGAVEVREVIQVEKVGSGEK